MRFTPSTTFSFARSTASPARCTASCRLMRSSSFCSCTFARLACATRRSASRSFRSASKAPLAKLSTGSPFFTSAPSGSTDSTVICQTLRNSGAKMGWLSAASSSP